MTARSLPRYSESLPPHSLRYLNIRSVLDIMILTVLAVIAIWAFVPTSWRPAAWALLAVSVALGIAIDLPVVNRLQVRNTSYEVTEDAVRLRRGMLLRRDTVISTAQLLNVTIIDGPLLRRYGLAKVAFTTIAHIEPLGPVTAAEALRLRSRALAGFAGGRDDR